MEGNGIFADARQSSLYAGSYVERPDRCCLSLDLPGVINRSGPRSIGRPGAYPPALTPESLAIEEIGVRSSRGIDDLRFFSMRQ